jgi:hypothetical protein
MKKIHFSHGCGFRKILRALLYGFLCVCTGLFLTSCAPKGPRKETYLRNTNLSRISKVAIIASISDPKVSYSTEKSHYTPSLGSPLVVFGPAGLLVLLSVDLTEAAIRRGVDREHAGKVREHMDLSHFEETVAQSFIQPLKKGGCFQVTDYITDKNQDVRQLSTKGYDAIIRLLVGEISLKRRADDNQVRLNVYVRGEMEYLSEGKVVWDREESVLSPEKHPLDYYKENGLKELDAMLEKAGRNLAYDFVYLR